MGFLLKFLLSSLYIAGFITLGVTSLQDLGAIWTTLIICITLIIGIILGGIGYSEVKN